ncbi:hypothetical protein [Aureivirga sp. CE67]|uniref:hypothetical protein n=1 Tax=Aureivirga sp. CE67 TaxID=1788983 RepID=UPI0018CBE903|nr:hypothetical protein [Aureivirga sp. CE67]
MNQIEIQGDKVIYTSNFHSYDKDISWNLDVKSISFIGFVNCMDGDDDSDFLVFIDKELDKYFLNISRNLNGKESFKLLLEKNFNIKLEDYDLIEQSKNIIIYPKEYLGRNLYQNSFKKSMLKISGFCHVADGELNDFIK